MSKSVLSRLRYKQGKFIRPPHKGDKVKIYLNNGGVAYGRVTGLIDGPRQKLSVKLCDDTWTAWDADYCLEERFVVLESSQPVPGKIGDIVQAVSDHFGVPIQAILNGSRKRRDAYPRHIAGYLCRRYTDLTLAQIGRRFHRNHSNIYLGIKGIEERIPFDKQLEQDINLITKAIC